MLYQKKLNGIKFRERVIGLYRAIYIGLFLVSVMESNDNNMKLGITVDEARKMLGIGRNLMLQLVKLEGFPAVRFKRKIIINKELLPKWFAENYGQYGGYKL